MSDITLERKRELYATGRYFVKVPSGFSFESEAQHIEYIDRCGQWFDSENGADCSHQNLEPQLVCETCGHREAAPDRSQVELLAGALADMQRTILPVNPERYRLMAEPLLAEIAKTAEVGGSKGDYDQLKAAASNLLAAIEKIADYDPETRVGRAMAALETAMGIPIVLDETIPENEIRMTDGAQTVAALISPLAPSPWSFLYERRPDDGQKVIVWCQDDPTSEPWVESGKYRAAREEFEFSHSILPTGLRGVLIFWRPDDIEPPTAEQIAAGGRTIENRG